MITEIKRRYSGAVIFSADVDGENDSMRLGTAVVLAIDKDTNLSEANLRGAYLTGAELNGCSLIDGGQRSDGYRFIGQVKDEELWIHAGCRYFEISEARKHWEKTRGGTALGIESLARVDLIETIYNLKVKT